MTLLLGLSLLLLAGLVALGFVVVTLTLRRLEGRQRRWFQTLSDLVATAAAEDGVRALLAALRYADPRCLMRQGQKIYSQGDEDGILAEIFRRIGTTSRRFLEIGVGDGLENNTLALLVEGWTGTWIDGSPQNAAKIRARFTPMLKDGRLRFLERRITLATLSDLLPDAGDGNLDLFSLDIDGNDYHIAAQLPLKARVLVVEYNARFAPPIEWVMAYDENHVWKGTDHFGASLAAYALLLKDKGYSLVGCNLCGTNAFFVRSDLVGDDLFLRPFTAEAHYEPARYWLMAGFRGGHPPDFRPSAGGG